MISRHRSRRWRSPLIAGLLALSALGALGCRSEPSDRTPAADASTSPPASGQGIEIREPRVMLMPEMGAAYFTIVNLGAEEDRLVAVESPLATSVESHESRDDGGVMRMVPHPEGFAIAGGASLALEPGGKHLMLHGVADSNLSEVPLTLFFERAGRVEIRAPVLEHDAVTGPPATSEGMSHDHH